MVFNAQDYGNIIAAYYPLLHYLKQIRPDLSYKDSVIQTHTPPKN